MKTTIDVTPRGFDPSNPNAQKNIETANQAAADIEEVVRQKAEFLREIVEDHFGGIEGLLGGLKFVRLEEDIIDGVEISDIREQWERLDRNHTVAGENLMRAIGGHALVS